MSISADDHPNKRVGKTKRRASRHHDGDKKRRASRGVSRSRPATTKVSAADHHQDTQPFALRGTAFKSWSEYNRAVQTRLTALAAAEMAAVHVQTESTGPNNLELKILLSSLSRCDVSESQNRKGRCSSTQRRKKDVP
ncbi:hypothetical protein [uncultured Bradyrhizobium sp.]|uniref:hypothetical protein n=1 Tax=uncultured Bradyrhizobium sp. TaxID=199684 RepID=UPI0035CA7F56